MNANMHWESPMGISQTCLTLEFPFHRAFGFCGHKSCSVFCFTFPISEEGLQFSALRACLFVKQYQGI